MWPLRRNVQYNKSSFFIEIFFSVLFFHFLLMGMLFVCDTNKFHKEKFIIDTGILGSTVVFMPLHKKISQEIKAEKIDSNKNNKQVVISHHVYEQKVAAAQKKQTKSDQKLLYPVQHNNSPKQSSVQKEQVAIEKEYHDLHTTLITKSEKKPDLKKKKEVVKKPATKNSAVKAKVDFQKNIEIKKNEDAEKKDQIKFEAKIEKNDQTKILKDSLEKVVEHAPIAVEQNTVAPVQEIDSIDLQNVSFIGKLDLEMMYIKEQIQHEIALYYKPPVGISKKIACQLTIIVGLDGKAYQVTIKKSSGSIANDVCARAALLKVQFPKEVIGKEIIVELGQS